MDTMISGKLGKVFEVQELALKSESIPEAQVYKMIKASEEITDGGLILYANMILRVLWKFLNFSKLYQSQ